MAYELTAPSHRSGVDRNLRCFASRILNFWFVLVSLTIGVMSFYFHFSTIVLWLLIGGLFLCCDRVAARKCSICWDSRLFIFLYSYISLWGLFYAISYYEFYGLYFGPNGDDSLFYDYIVNGDFDNSYYLFIFIMAVFGNCVSFIKSLSLVDLLIFNWGIAAFVCMLSFYYASLVIGRLSGFIPVLLGVSMNYAFLDTAVHLYRDSMVLMFFLLSLISAQRKHYWTAIAFAVVTGILRGANGFVALLAVLLYLIFRKMKTQCIRTSKGIGKKLWVYVLLMFVIIVIVQYAGSFIIMYGTSFINQNRGINSKTMSAYVHNRENKWLERFDESKVLGSGVMGIVIKPAVNLLFPLTFPPVSAYEQVKIKNQYVQYVRMFKAFSIAIWFGIVASVWVFPGLLSGVLASLKLPYEKAIPVILFVVLLFAVSLISFQYRHRCAYIVLIPSIIGLGRLVKANRNLMFNSQVILILLILLFNVRYYIMPIIF